jgi:hypothetical protein
MAKYITVLNRPNRIATVHLASCTHLGPDPLIQTASADRLAFEDGIDALATAKDVMSANFGFCGHCLADLRWIKAGYG